MAQQTALWGQSPLRITQGYYSAYSHAGSLALDIGGAHAGASGNLDSFYAPWDGRLVRRRDNANGELYIESLQPVLSPCGRTEHQRLLLMHTTAFHLAENSVFQQGDLLYTEGGMQGGKPHALSPHIHIEGGFGTWASVGGAKQAANAQGTYAIARQARLEDMLYLPQGCEVKASGGLAWVFAAPSVDTMPAAENHGAPMLRIFDTVEAGESVPRVANALAAIASGQRIAFATTVNGDGATRLALSHSPARQYTPEAIGEVAALQLAEMHNDEFLATCDGYTRLYRLESCYHTHAEVAAALQMLAGRGEPFAVASPNPAGRGNCWAIGTPLMSKQGTGADSFNPLLAELQTLAGGEYVIV